MTTELVILRTSTESDFDTGTVLALAPKNRHQQFAIKNGKYVQRNSTNRKKRVFRRTKRRQKIPLKVYGKHSKSGPVTPTSTTSPNFAATQLLRDRSDFWRSTRCRLPHLRLPSRLEQCDYCRKKICKMR